MLYRIKIQTARGARYYASRSASVAEAVSACVSSHPLSREQGPVQIEASESRAPIPGVNEMDVGACRFLHEQPVEEVVS